MPLVLEIEHLLGVAFAAQGPDSSDPDWPPQPDRVFSALVAAWAARGERSDERAALEWLESQSAPYVVASGYNARPAPISYVPPNDKLQKSSDPAWRKRQPRRFPAAIPHNRTVRLFWSSAEKGVPLSALDAMARDVSYVGHSASLTRCHFKEGEALPEAKPARRTVYRGRLRELEIAYSKNDAARRRRPSPGEFVSPPSPAAPQQTSAFSRDWLIFEVVGGKLDLRAAPLACKALIKTVMRGYGELHKTPPAWVCGHAHDGAPLPDPHLAAAPLAFVDFEHADGTLLGFALIPPRGRDDPLMDAEFAAALLAVSETTEDGARILHLRMGAAGVLDLALTLEADRASLSPTRYVRRGSLWSTVTPLVLDRHVDPPRSSLRGDGSRHREEVQALITQACVNIGLPRPTRVIAGKHSAISGAPSAYPSGSAPLWTGWRVPEALRSRSLTHATLLFEERIAGPVLIGAGRFAGLGLCLPFVSRDAP